jgi:hypothetical protein
VTDTKSNKASRVNTWVFRDVKARVFIWIKIKQTHDRLINKTDKLVQRNTEGCWLTIVAAEKL